VSDSELPPCRVCGAATARYAEALLMGKHTAAYFRCTDCGFIQTEAPYWLEEAYASSAINRADVGMLQRNLRLATVTRALITLFFNRCGRFLDYGGGYGVFVRLMRDAGYHFYRYDKHCANLFAADFEAAAPDGADKYELLTAFELFEHLADPVAEVRGMLEFSPSIFFTTELVPPGQPTPESWSYFGVEHGQHISFYTLRSLERLAEKLGLTLYSDGKFRHLLTSRKLSRLGYRLASTYRVAALLGPFTRRASLVPADYRQITGKEL
jgi:hypothetical protein